jgi:hypothetical protein
MDLQSLTIASFLEKLPSSRKIEIISNLIMKFDLQQDIVQHLFGEQVVLVTIDGGIANVEHSPLNVNVKVVDYDNGEQIRQCGFCQSWEWDAEIEELCEHETCGEWVCANCTPMCRCHTPSPTESDQTD